MRPLEFDDFSDIEDSSPIAPQLSDDTTPSKDTLSLEPQQRRLEDLTLAELFGQFLRAPMRTWRGLTYVASTPIQHPSQTTEAPPIEAILAIEDTTTRLSIEIPTDVNADAPQNITTEQREGFREARRQFLKLGLYVMAFASAFWGSVILVSAEVRYESGQLDRGAIFLIAGFLLWLFAEFSDNFRDRRFSFNLATVTDETIPTSELLEDTTVRHATDWVVHPTRIFASMGVIFFSLWAWIGTAQNQFSATGFWAWLLAVLCAVVLFAPKTWSPAQIFVRTMQWMKGIRWFSPPVLIMLGIMIVGTWFRFHDLMRVPPEMTSDHIEKLINAHEILNGDRSVFFTNNGGRESLQMYLIALFAQFTGIGLTFNTLKIVAIIESILTLPLLWWLGREVVGEKDRRLGNWLGLSLAALVAVSYWHLAITRLGLRIVLTPIVATLLLGLMIRALRHNRRGDFILMGVVLGFGLYTYQAVRMMPVFIVLAVGWAMWCRLRQREQLRFYMGHLAILVMIAFIAFIPLFRFSVEYPNLFWMRTAGRLLGDDLIQTTDEHGNLVYRDATLAERMEAFNNNVPILADNLRNALLMYNWKSDVAWISAYPNYPAMDTVTGAFLSVGLGAWIAFAIKRREGILLIVPMMVIVMLLPSALSIAQPGENPSATRTSGTLPPVYLIAALPMALFISQSSRVLKKTGMGISLVVLGVLLFVALSLNSRTYFENYYQSYLPQSLPHSDAGRVLRGFALSDGAYSNAFMISYPFWFDHRTIGLEGGMINWTNGIDVNLHKVPDFVSDTYYCPNRTMRLDVDKDLLFFYHLKDDDMEQNLRLWFPAGRTTIIESYQPNDDFKIYRVPALGEAGFRAFARQFALGASCAIP